MSKKHKCQFSVKRLRNMCKGLCCFDKENLRFVEDAKQSSIQYRYLTYPNGLHENWYDIISSGDSNRTKRYVGIIGKIMEMKKDFFYSGLLTKIPNFENLYDLAIIVDVNGFR